MIVGYKLKPVIYIPYIIHMCTKEMGAFSEFIYTYMYVYYTYIYIYKNLYIYRGWCV